MEEILEFCVFAEVMVKKKKRLSSRYHVVILKLRENNIAGILHEYY